MIEKMTKYSFILLKGGEEKFLDQLRELGVVDIKRSSVPVDAHSTDLMDRIGQVKHEIESLENGVDTHLTELLDQLDSMESAKDAIAPWGDYDRDKTDALSKAGVPIHFYCVRKKAYDPEWESKYPIEIILDDGKTVHFVLAGGNYGFPVTEMHTPLSTIHELEGMINAKDKEIERYRKHLEDRKSEIPGLEARRNELTDELTVYLASLAGESAVEDRLTIYEAFAPTDCDARLAEALDSSDALWFKAVATKEDNPPISLRNNWFTRQFEVLTDMYGRPAYDEFDPTPILGPFFLLFFAMCMGDAGYGLLLILIGWLLKKKVPSMAKLGPLVMMLGVGTFLVGIVLHTFFGINLYTAEWVPQWLKRCMVSGSIAGYDAQMVLAVGVGIFHICLATIVKAICHTSRFGFTKCISTWGWTLLIVGSVITGGLALLGVIDMPVVKIILIVLGIVSGLGIFFLNDLHRNPLLNVGSGLWSTYNTVTGLMGDVLSYLRLYALGLAGGMLGNTFNTLAGMTLGIKLPGVNFLLFIIILLIGHVLNLALSCLGAFVHPLRLTFVEYFKNSGYEGTGRDYRPLK
ncbi:MAG: ATPase V [Bacteroidales bacterium]|nr:ATPase V [Bacteroidales bacterium]MBR4817679.1 ATPase V [Bacteroidales bacterium]MBR5054646.1 ATPase V [Bacteroidales bacterium]